MIIGDGDIASVLKDKKDKLFFASGVSNSQETRESEYKREEGLLLSQLLIKGKPEHIVYFSTLAVFYSNTRYVQHKKLMEKLVRTNFNRYTIIRLGNITWGINPHTLINYLQDNKNAVIQDVYRYICDKEEFLHWMEMIPDWSCEMNITGARMKVKDIAYEYT